VYRLLTKGHPIAGDDKYGDDQFNQQMRHDKLKRLFLHAEKLEIFLPEIDYRVSAIAPLPPALQQVLNGLKPVSAKNYRKY
jgi:23S rRNA pseudouridine955/2504/2580 synthase